jgi:hypothetical protein
MSETENAEPATPAVVDAGATVGAEAVPAAEASGDVAVATGAELGGPSDPVAGPVVTPAADESRPWHGAANPYEGIFQWAKAEIARLEAKIGGLGI